MPFMKILRWSRCCAGPGAALVRVLPGASANLFRVLVPDDCAEPQGFHDLLIEDMSATIVRPASAGDLTELRQHWPPSLLSGMTQHQIDMKTQRRECKRQLGNHCPGRCPHCGTYISSRLSRHVMSFHLILGQQWRCPIPWCSVWKGAAQVCVDHLRLWHYTGSSVKASTLGKCFPSWMVTCSAWITALGTGVSEIAIDVMTKLSDFTHQAFAKACSAAKRGSDSSTESTPPPLGPVTQDCTATHLRPLRVTCDGTDLVTTEY